MPAVRIRQRRAGARKRRTEASHFQDKLLSKFKIVKRKKEIF